VFGAQHLVTGARSTAASLSARAQPASQQQRRGAKKRLWNAYPLHGLIEGLLSLAPSPSNMTGHPARIATLTLYLREFGIGFTRRRQLSLGLGPLALLHALHLTLAMKDVEPHGDRGSRGRFGLLNLSLAPFVGQLHTSLKPTATIGDNVLQVRPVLHHCTPTGPGAVWSSLAR
jgi:hypothetical protein